MEDEPEKYQSHFSEYIKKGIEPDDFEALYKKVHAAIRADPTGKKPDKPAPKEHKRLDTAYSICDCHIFYCSIVFIHLILDFICCHLL